MNILIVDDEYYIVQGIRNVIDCKKLGISEVFGAYSMKQAQKVFEEHDVAILLTDIEMPKGSGIDLVRWVYDSGYAPVVLFLTGHQNFDYAYTAIKLQCLDYLLKPVRPAVLAEKLSEAVRVVKKRTESFWFRLCTSDVPFSREEVSAVLKEIQLPSVWMEQRFCFLYCKINSGTGEPDSRREEFFTAVENLFETDPAGAVSAFVKLEENRYVIPVLYAEHSVYEQLVDDCKKVLAAAGNFPYSCTIFVSEPCFLPESFQCLQEMKTFGESVLAAENSVIPMRTVNSENLQKALSPLPDVPVTQWCEWLLQYRTDRILSDVRSFLKKGSILYSSDNLITLYYGIIQTVFSALSKKGIDAKTLFPKIAGHETLTKAISSADSFLWWTEMILAEVNDILTADADSSSLLESVRRIVRKHLTDSDLNRTLIADELHLNPDYLSYLFHRKTGQSLVSFINGERIFAAKTLLLVTDETMSAIAEAVGYFDSPYFFRQFKKITGMTPQQYRDTGRIAER
ncbi:MAG TPA: hypothetical protein DCL73_16105 [Treponema sp.]|nr:hypothetical protein [Treponema sp.]